MGKFDNFGGALKRALPTILTIVGSVGVVGTAILTAKAMHEIDENDGGDIKKGWKKFWKAGLVGAATIGCMAGSNILNKKQQVSIASGAMMLTETCRKYQQKMKEKYPEIHEEIMEEIKMERTKDDVYIYSPGFMGSCSVGFEGISEQNQQFYDCFSKRCFTARPTQVLQAMYHANRNFSLGGAEMLNQFYEFLGLEQLDEFNDLMWMVNDDMYWIDFSIERRKDKNGVDMLVNGRPIFDISVEWDPMTEEEWNGELPHTSYRE